jgi:hypothetical protein
VPDMGATGSTDDAFSALKADAPTAVGHPRCVPVEALGACLAAQGVSAASRGPVEPSRFHLSVCHVSD